MEKTISQTGRLTRQGTQYLIVIHAENMAALRPFLNNKVREEIRLKAGGRSVIIEQTGMIYAMEKQLRVFLQKRHYAKIVPFAGVDSIDMEITVSTLEIPA